MEKESTYDTMHNVGTFHYGTMHIIPAYDTNSNGNGHLFVYGKISSKHIDDYESTIITLSNTIK
jgi:hypothetical protein